MNLIKPPFSYAGNKYRVLKNGLQQELENGLGTNGRLFDLAFGSGSVILNSPNGGVAYEYNEWLVKMLNRLSCLSSINQIQGFYDIHFPNGKITKDGYLSLRSAFNIFRKDRDMIESATDVLIILMQVSFNSLLRFNKSGDYNVPVGRKPFDISKLIRVHSRLNEISIDFRHGSISSFSYFDMNSHDLVYIDPPYLLTPYKYGSWTEQDEIDMYNMLDTVDSNGLKFALSNVWQYRGKQNVLLQDWVKCKYNIKVFDSIKYKAYTPIYGVSRSDSEVTTEVLITNF